MKCIKISNDNVIVCLFSFFLFYKVLGYRQGPLPVHISRVRQLLLIIFIYLKIADVTLSFLNALS